VRPSLSLRVENPVTVDDFVVLIFKHREIKIGTKLRFELLDKLPRIIVAVNAHGQDLNFLFLFFR